MPEKIPFKIILTVNFSPWSPYSGGGQRSTHNLASAFSELGYDVTVVFSKSPFEKIELPDDIPYSVEWAVFPAFNSKRNALFRPLTPYFMKKKLRGILQNISPETPVIVHANGEEGVLFNSLRKNEHFRFGFISTCRYPHLPDELKSPKSQGFFTSIKNSIVFRKYLQQLKTIQSADFCSPPSFWAGKDIPGFPGIDASKMAPVHNGVPKEFLNYHWKKNHSGPIVFFGRMDDDKGVDTLLNGLSNLDRNMLPEIYLIGRGPKKNMYVQLAEALSLKDKVRFFDWKTHNELGEIIEQASMVVLPSRVENFTLAVLGAMCVGAPVIATNAGGTSEMMTHGKDGFLIEVNDEGALAKYVSEVLANPDKAALIGANASKRIRTHLTWKSSCEKFLILYEKAWMMSIAE